MTTTKKEKEKAVSNRIKSLLSNVFKIWKKAILLLTYNLCFSFNAVKTRPAFVMRVTLALTACLFAMVALVTSTERKFEASGEYEQGTEHHAPLSLEHESHVEDQEGSTFDSGSDVSGSGGSGSGRETEIQT